MRKNSRLVTGQKMKFHLSLILLTLFGACSSTQAQEALNLTILHMNDHHSHLSEGGAGFLNIYEDDIPADVRAKNGNTTYIRAYYGGYPRVVTAFHELKATAEADGRDVLNLHAGDAITGSAYFTLFEGEADARLMTHVCFDAFVPGNHEFDKGDAGLAKFLRALQSEVDASMTCDQIPAILAANIVPHEKSPLLADDVPQFQNSKVFNFSNGERVGVIGLDTRGKVMNSSMPDPGTVLLDEKETAQAEIRVLLASGVNKIVLLTHIGYENDLNWMAELDGVDVVVGADSHSLLGDDSSRLFGSVSGPYATVIEKRDGSKVCVVQAWEYSKVVGNLNIDFDEAGDVLSCEGMPIFPFNPDRVTNKDPEIEYDLDEADATAVLADLIARSEGQVHTFVEYKPAALHMAEYTSQMEELSQTVIAVVPEAIPLEQNGFESGACDVVAEAFLLNPYMTADFSITNRGGCRTSLDEGNLTVEDAYVLLPFSNTMMNVEVTGQQVKNILEDAMDFYLSPSGGRGAYPRAGGLRFDVNEAEEYGKRVTNIEINERLEATWVAIGMDNTYILVTHSFLAAARDGYNEFANIDPDKFEDTYVEYAQSFMEYAKSVGTLTKVAADRVSTQNWSNRLTSSTVLPIESNNSLATTDANNTLDPTESNTVSPAESVPSAAMSSGIMNLMGGAFIAFQIFIIHGI